jgi:hypothetical protein
MHPWVQKAPHMHPAFGPRWAGGACLLLWHVRTRHAHVAQLPSGIALASGTSFGTASPILHPLTHTTCDGLQSSPSQHRQVSVCHTHDLTAYTQVTVRLATEVVVCEGMGTKKKDAEQAAAHAMLQRPELQPFLAVAP